MNLSELVFIIISFNYFPSFNLPRIIIKPFNWFIGFNKYKLDYTTCADYEIHFLIFTIYQHINK